MLEMVALINIVAFLIIALVLGYYFEVSAIRVMPIVNTGLIVLLFVLAFFQKLKYVDVISVLVVSVSLLLTIIYRNKIDFDRVRKSLLSGSAVFAALSIVAIYFCFRYRMAIDSDELGVWAVEVKSLFFWEGFADKGKHISVLYGDYNPGQMLYEWWTCHFKSEYTEGLMYVGYYWLYIIYTFPILDKLITKKMVVIKSIVAFVCLMILPSIMMIMGVIFMAAELPMCTIFASMMVSVWDISDREPSKLDYIEIMALSVIMILLKSSGAYFVVIVLVWYLILKRLNNKYAFCDLYVSLCLLVGFIPQIIWSIFCNINNRSSYFISVSDSLKSSSDNIRIFVLYLKVIIKTFLYHPTNVDGNARLNWTFAAVLVIVAAISIYMVGMHLVEKNKMIVYGIIYAVSLGIMIISLAYTHAFIFEEDRYLQEQVMMCTLSRYLSPLLLGVFIFMVYLFLCSATSYGKFLITTVLSVLILMSARWDILKDYYYGSDKYTEVVNYYRDWLKSDKSGFNAFLDNPPQDSVENILFVTSENESLDYRTLGFLACPHPIKVVNYNANECEEGSLNRELMENVTDGGYAFVYFDKMSKEILETECDSDIDNDIVYNISCVNGLLSFDTYSR